MNPVETYATNLVKTWIASTCKKRLAIYKRLYNQVLNSRLTMCPVCDPPHPINATQISHILQQIEQILAHFSEIIYRARSENLDIERGVGI